MRPHLLVVTALMCLLQVTEATLEQEEIDVGIDWLDGLATDSVYPIAPIIGFPPGSYMETHWSVNLPFETFTAYSSRLKIGVPIKYPLPDSVIIELVEHSGEGAGHNGEEHGEAAGHNGEEHGEGAGHNGEEHGEAAGHNGEEHGEGAGHNGEEHGEGSGHNGEDNGEAAGHNGGEHGEAAGQNGGEHGEAAGHNAGDDHHERVSRSRRVSRQERSAIYKRLEETLQEAGVDGRSCLLRTICEVAEVPFDQGLIGEVINTIFTASLAGKPNTTEEGREYEAFLEAERLGRQAGGCEDHFSQCMTSPFDLIPYAIHTVS